MSVLSCFRLLQLQLVAHQHLVATGTPFQHGGGREIVSISNLKSTECGSQ